MSSGELPSRSTVGTATRPGPATSDPARTYGPPGQTSRASPAPAGSSVEVEWGDEHFQPLPYHGIDVGRFKAATMVRPGESIGDATFRLWCELNEVAMKIRDVKFRQFAEGVEKLANQQINVPPR